VYRTTIGIPTYNRGFLLARAISSALAQGPQVCVIVSDNASTDNTPSVVEGFQEYGDRLTYIRHDTNQGATSNFRAVLAAARTPFFMWLGDDDWLDEGYETACAEILQRDDAYTLVSGLARYYDDPNASPIGEDVLMALQQDDPTQRVCAYYSLVRENGVFYGLAKRSMRMRVGVEPTFGFDWTMVAAAAFEGKVLTLQNIHVHRIVGGASTPSGLVKLHGLRGLARRPEFHELILGWVIFRDIGFRGFVGAGLPLGTRIKLGLRASFAFLYARYGSIFSGPSRLRVYLKRKAIASEEMAAADRQLRTIDNGDAGVGPRNRS